VCPGTVFASNSVLVDVHAGRTSRSPTSWTGGSRPQGGGFAVQRLGRIYRGAGVAGEGGCLKFPPCGSKHASSPGGGGGSGGAGGICRIGGSSWNWGILVCGVLALCKLRARPTAIRMYSDPIGIPRLLVAMLVNVNCSASPRLYSERTHSQYTTKERESELTSCSRSSSRLPPYSDFRQYSGQWANQAKSSVPHTRSNRTKNIALLSDPALGVETCNSAESRDE